MTTAKGTVDPTKNAKNNSSSSSLLSRFFTAIRFTGVAVVILAVVLKFAFENATFLQTLDSLLDSLQERKDHLANHVYLHGNYAPVADEHRAVPLEVVEGALPDDLDGLFVRNGPNPIPSQISKRYHWFDGHGMLHSVRIQSQSQPTTATYSNQFIPTPRYQIEKKQGKEVFAHVGEFTGVSGLIKALVMNTGMAKVFGLTTLTSGQANTHTIMYQNKFLCCHEASLPFEVQLDGDGRIVKAVGFEDFGGILDFPVSAHPKKDPVTGNFLFHGYAGDPSLVKRYGPIKVGEYDVHRKEISYYLGVSPGDKHTSLAHDMMFTKNWIIVYDSSILFDPSKILEPDFGFFSFNKKVPLRMGLVPRTGENHNNITHRDVIWIDAGAPHSLVHPLTAWEEEDGTVVVWVPLGDAFDGTLTNTSAINVFYMTELRLDPKSKRLVSKKVIDSDLNVEFSRVPDNCLGRFCRFGYTGILDQRLGGDALFTGFAVWDMELGELSKSVYYASGESGQEPVVIPKPGREEDNAVYLATFLYNDIDKQSYFVLYDGENEYNLVTRLRVPHRVPFGFHGQWVTGEELRSHIDFHAGQSHA